MIYKVRETIRVPYPGSSVKIVHDVWLKGKIDEKNKTNSKKQIFESKLRREICICEEEEYRACPIEGNCHAIFHCVIFFFLRLWHIHISTLTHRNNARARTHTGTAGRHWIVCYIHDTQVVHTKVDVLSVVAIIRIAEPRGPWSEQRRVRSFLTIALLLV